jgi:tetratricopeptide (TPR) repeat protein
MINNIQTADSYFSNKDYKTALHFYSIILKENPENQDAQIGILLSDMAMNDDDEKAQALFDYYVIIKNQNEQIAYDTVNDLICENDFEFDYKINDVDGITYKDFEEILDANENNEKEIFNNLIFSTKLIITHKAEFLKFIILLLKYDFDHMTFDYLENFIFTFGNNDTMIDMLNTLTNLENKPS